MPACIDLRARFGSRYRTRWEADGATRYETPEAERPWLLEMPCRYGVVYPYGGDILAAVVTGRYAREQIASLACVRSRRGGAELVVTFHADDAAAIFAILRPKRRRQISPTLRAELLGRLARINQGRQDATVKVDRRRPNSDAPAETIAPPTPDPPDAGNVATGAPIAAAGDSGLSDGGPDPEA